MSITKEPAATVNQHRLDAIDGETLMTTPLPPIHFTIGGLLPQGLHILAGAPKVGKSWLALWLCLCVAKGENVWSFPSARGDVLYLCLEDSYSRIQNRLLDITDDAPPNLFFATMSEKLRGGLEQQIECFLTEHPGTALIVIDTLQRIRSIANDVNPYASDYRDLGILKELADRHRIAILLIHHLRKMNDDDPMNMISGTTGISGATDSNFVLRKDKRGGSTATLYCTGRDIEYHARGDEYFADPENAEKFDIPAIDYTQPDSSEFRQNWMYMPQFRILDQADFATNMAVFLLLFIFVAILCFAAVGVILFTRSMTLAITNAWVYEDLRKLGASNTYLRQTARGQISRVFKAPIFVGTLLIFGFYTLILYGNGEGGITQSEWASLGSCLLVVAAVSVLLYALYRVTLRSAYKELNL